MMIKLSLCVILAALAMLSGRALGQDDESVCDGLSTINRQTICMLEGGPSLGLPYEYWKKVDDKYWVTTKKYPNKPIGPNQLRDACIDEFGPGAEALELYPDTLGMISEKTLDPIEAIILTYFWQMAGQWRSDSAEQTVLMNESGSAIMKDGGTLAVLEHGPQDCSISTVQCKSGLHHVHAPADEPYLRVGCMLKAPPANAEDMEDAAMGGTPIVTVDKIPVPPAASPASTDTPTDPPTDPPTDVPAPAPAPGTLGAAPPAPPGGPASRPDSAVTPKAAPGPSPAAASDVVPESLQVSAENVEEVVVKPEPEPAPASDVVPKAAPGPSPAAAPGLSPTSTGSASVSGDPHLKLLNGKKIDFMGGCDLVLLSCPAFASNLGMRIHVRTKINTWWSFVEVAVLQIGDQTVEIQGGPDGGQHWINGKIGAATTTEGFDLSLSGFKARMKRAGPKQNKFRIDFGNGNAMSMETFKSFVSVNWRVEGPEWKGAIGLLGSFDDDGAMMSRDRSTVIENPVEFGKHWQVLVNEPMLFHSVDGTVQAPEECVMPDATLSESRQLRRRLGESLIAQEAAEKTCAHISNKENFDACVFDVLATNDVEMSGAY